MATVRLLGGAWLIEHLSIALVQPLSVKSEMGGRRATFAHAENRRETYTQAMDPGDSIPAHLTFLLKHEDIHLELLSRVFDAIEPQTIADWVQSEPTGQYARRTGFLYEWLTGRQVPLAAETVPTCNYVDALDPDKVLVATRAVNDSRWRVRDNMPGTREFCPVVRWTEPSSVAATFDVAAAFYEQEATFGAEVMRRSAVWMTLKESSSSFLIEGEQDQETKIRRFAAVMENQTGEGSVPLTAEALAKLQASILGATTTLQRFGLRRSPVFVGETRRYENVVHYVAPPWPSVSAMVQGLACAIERTEGQPQRSVARAAVAAFGFVYIHPLADGNGRIHRFLINDILRRDGVVQAPFILPISALITDSPKERIAYDGALELFSKPLMRRYADAYRFTSERHVEEDGVESNFQFEAYDAAMPAWRYPDLTGHVTYLGGVIKRTISQEMHQQAAFFRAHDQARRHVKELIEGPDSDIDAIIRSVQENQGKLSGKLRGRFPVLEQPGIWKQVADAVSTAFGRQPDGPSGLENQSSTPALDQAAVVSSTANAPAPTRRHRPR